MRNSTITWCSTLFMGATALAAPTTQPATTQPTELTPPPIVRPIEEQTVLILPFHETAGTSFAWLSKAIPQDLLADLSRATRARVEAPTTRPPAADAAEAVRSGREANASLVVYGQYQIVANQVRITGQIIDVATEKPGGSFAATGSVNDVFPVEDSISNQLRRSLPPGWLTTTLPPANQNGQTGVEPYATTVAPGQTTAQLPQYYSYTYPDYTTPASPYYYGDYPYYGYAVPYYGPDVWFYGGWDFYHHHYWDHGFHDHGFDHGFARPDFGHAPSARPGGGSFHGGGGMHGGGGHGR